MNMKVGDLVWVIDLEDKCSIKMLSKISRENNDAFIVGASLNFSKVAPHIYSTPNGPLYEMFEITNEEKVEMVIGKLNPERVLMEY